MADRTVLITGGTGGLGCAVTALFVARGWRVVLPVRQPATGLTGTSADPRIDATVESSEGRSAGVTDGEDLAALAAEVGLIEPVFDADLTDARAVDRCVAVAAAEPTAPLRAVVNLVGGYASDGRVAESDPDTFEAMLRLNVRPTYLVTRAALPHLVTAGGGCVVCVGSRAALAPFPGASGYITAKSAVAAFASAVAVEYRDRGVRCNTVLPSVIDTPANRIAQPNADHSRWVPPEELASVIAFLASEESAPVSGAAIPVDGRG